MRIFSLLLLLTVPALADPYTSYTNVRYGYRLGVPPGFSARPESPNLDGRNFASGDGAVVTVYGSNNVLSHTVDSELKDLLKSRAHQPLSRGRGKNWFSLSWIEKGQVVGLKSFVGKGCQDTVIVHYPVDKKTRYHELFQSVQASFVPGDLNTFH